MEPYAMIQVSILLQPHRTVVANSSQATSVSFGGTSDHHSRNPEILRNSGWKKTGEVSRTALYPPSAFFQGTLPVSEVYSTASLCLNDSFRQATWQPQNVSKCSEHARCKAINEFTRAGLEPCNQSKGTICAQVLCMRYSFNCKQLKWYGHLSSSTILQLGC